MTEKERLQILIEDLPEPEVHTALRFVEYLRREASVPVRRAFREAPFDDEPVTPEDLAELAAAGCDLKLGRTASRDEAWAELLREP